MKFLVTVIIVVFFFKATAQLNYNQALLDTLQEIVHTNTPAKYFARLYSQTIEITNIHAHKLPDSVKRFVFGLESFFAPAFFDRIKILLLINHRPLPGGSIMPIPL